MIPKKVSSSSRYTLSSESYTMVQVDNRIRQYSKSRLPVGKSVYFYNMERSLFELGVHLPHIHMAQLLHNVTPT